MSDARWIRVAGIQAGDRHNEQKETGMARKQNREECDGVVIASGGDLVIGSVGGTSHHVVINGPVHSDSLRIGPNGVFINGERVNGPDHNGGAR